MPPGLVTHDEMIRKGLTMRFSVYLRTGRFLALAAIVLVAAGVGETATRRAPPQPPAAAAPGSSAASEFTADDTAALREAETLLEQVVLDAVESDETRADAATVLQRVHELLNDWNRPGLLDWYLDALASCRKGRVVGQLVRGGQAACKAGAYHLGGVREFWRKMDEMAAERGEELGADVLRLRKVFDADAAKLEKSIRGPAVKPLVLAPRRFVVSTLLKPIAEPKPPASPKSAKAAK